MGFLPLILIIVVFWFFMIRPQSKKQKEMKKAREAMAEGDKVVTAGGIYGRIRKVEDTTFMLEIAPNVTIKIEKTSVYAISEPAPAKGK